MPVHDSVERTTPFGFLVIALCAIVSIVPWAAIDLWVWEAVLRGG